ncbi:class I SAM-dependent methyltransferase [Azospirillum palustre]
MRLLPQRHPTGDLHFPDFPLWQGVAEKPGHAIALPFRLGIDGRGFLRQTTDREVRRRITEAYGDPNYRFITPPPGRTGWGTQLGEGKLRQLLEHAPDLEGRSILEIGAGTRHIGSRILADHGAARYVIVDPALDGEDVGRDPRLVCLPGFFPQTGGEAGSFDLAIAFSCLEHVDDPVAFLSAIRMTLKPQSGRCFLVFPDIARAFREGDVTALQHEHMLYLDRPGTEALFAAAGLEILRLTSWQDGFSCLATACPSPVLDSPPDLGAARQLLGQLAESYATRFAVTVKSMSERLGAGKRIACVGATNGLSQLLHLGGMGAAPNLAIFDGDPAKEGCFLAISPHPIRHTPHIADVPFDHVYITAGTFHGEIKAQLLRFGIPADRIEAPFGSASAGPL